MSSQSKSVTLALSLVVLAALSGCDKLARAAKPPAEAAKPVAPAATAATQAQAQAPDSPDAELVDGRKTEANLLKALGQPDARKGPTLTLQQNGRAGLVVTDDEESYNLLTKVIQVPTANGVQTVYEVTTFYIASPDGPASTFYDERGVAIESYAGYGQWRGAVFAISDQVQTYSVGDDSRVSTQLLDWSSKPHRKFDFKSRCQPSDWVSDTEIKGTCTRPASEAANPGIELKSGGEVIDAVFTRVGPNAWRVRELRAPKAKLLGAPDFPDNPPTAYDETVKGVAYSGDQ
ncbi:MAG: hypothetical protein KKC14_16405 [Alphaproteobacteria bacterium]|nr:hypothetical protein [Alphaproteobacteria bacterium]